MNGDSLVFNSQPPQQSADDAVFAGSLTHPVEPASILYRFTDRLYRAGDLAEIYDAALEAITAALDCDRASVLLFDAAGEMSFVAWRGLSDAYRRAVHGHTPWTQGEMDAEPLWVSDILASGESAAIKQAVTGEGIRALGMIPLSAAGGVVGKFMVYYAQPQIFTEREAELATMIARQLGFAIDQRRTEDARRRAEESLRAPESQLNEALEAGALAIFDFDHVAGRMNSAGRLSELYGYPAEHVMTIDDIRARYHPDDVDIIIARAKADLVDPALRQFSWTLRLALPAGAERWIEGIGEYVRDEDGRVVRSRGVVLDISERKRWEEHQRLLINELNHRVKNTLAIVQGLALQTFRSGEAVDRALPAFESRLSALSAAHNLLTQRNWQAASVRQVIEATVQAAVGAAAQRVVWDGEEIQLSPQTAVSVALATHELCTNAVKYGALSNETGRVGMVWRTFSADDGRRFTFEWREEGGPLVEAPQRTGFGSRMIERALAAELGGKAVLDFQPQGLICTIDAPLMRPEPA